MTSLQQLLFYLYDDLRGCGHSGLDPEPVALVRATRTRALISLFDLFCVAI